MQECQCLQLRQKESKWGNKGVHNEQLAGWAQGLQSGQMGITWQRSEFEGVLVVGLLQYTFLELVSFL